MCDKNDGKCMIDACCCCYDGIDCNDIELGCRHGSDCLCIRHHFCISASAPPLGFGLTTEEGEICKLGLFCCDYALIKPETLCAGADSFCCCYSVCAFPFDDDYVDKFVCSSCGLACAPECGCCVAPPNSPIIGKIKAGSETPAGEEMERK